MLFLSSCRNCLISSAPCISFRPSNSSHDQCLLLSPLLSCRLPVSLLLPPPWRRHSLLPLIMFLQLPLLLSSRWMHSACFLRSLLSLLLHILTNRLILTRCLPSSRLLSSHLLRCHPSLTRDHLSLIRDHLSLSRDHLSLSKVLLSLSMDHPSLFKDLSRTLYLNRTILLLTISQYLLPSRHP